MKVRSVNKLFHNVISLLLAMDRPTEDQGAPPHLSDADIWLVCQVFQHWFNIRQQTIADFVIDRIVTQLHKEDADRKRDQRHD